MCKKEEFSSVESTSHFGKKEHFSEKMTFAEVDQLMYRMLKYPDRYTQSIHSIGYTRALNYGLVLLKTKALIT